MTRAEAAELFAGMIAKWPNFKASDAGLAQFFYDLSDRPVEEVAISIEVLYRTGREFAPTGAQIRKQLIELANDAPRWSEVWWWLNKAVSKFGYAGPVEARRWLGAQHPLTGQLVAEIGWRDFCLREDPPGVREAQCRNKWERLVERVEREEAFAGLPTAGLRTLERVARGPRLLADVLPQLESQRGQLRAA